MELIRNPNRTKPTRTAAAEISDGNIRAIKVTATTSKQTSTMPQGFRFALIRNDGSNNVKINFGTDSNANHFTLLPGVMLPAPIQIVEGTEINYISVGGDSDLEVLIWG